jgi:hypothetical protein
MAVKTYQGSCHCKKVRFEAQIDFSQGTFRCNCTRCSKTRLWGVNVKPEAFRLVSGENDLTHYGNHIQGMFCKHCGVSIGGRGELEHAGGKFIAINVGAFDNVDPKELNEIPIAFLDGRHDRWDRQPEFKNYL